MDFELLGGASEFLNYAAPVAERRLM